MVGQLKECVWRTNLKKLFADYAPLLLIAGAVILLDQLTKSYIRANLPLGQVWHPEWTLSLYARIVHVQNYGAAFGIFQSMSKVITVLSFIVAGVILYTFPQIPKKDRLTRLAMGLLLGGAMGNLIDRLFHGGYVTDFISLGPFPVFNVADASISTGVAILFGVMLWQEVQKKSAKDPAVSQETASEVLSEEAPGE